MSKLTVGDLRKAIQNEPDSTEISFQGNIPGTIDDDDDFDGQEEVYNYTTCVGHLFDAFNNGKTFVLDCAITNREDY